MNNLGTLLQLVLVVFTLVSFAALALMRTNVVSLRESLEDLRKDNADHKQRQIDSDTKYKNYKESSDKRNFALESKNRELATELQALSKVITGEAHWVAIGDTLDAHHREAQQHWKLDETLLAEIRNILKARGA